MLPRSLRILSLRKRVAVTLEAETQALSRLVVSDWQTMLMVPMQLSCSERQTSGDRQRFALVNRSGPKQHHQWRSRRIRRLTCCRARVEDPRIVKSGVATVPPDVVKPSVGLQRSRRCCAIHRFKTIHELKDSQAR